MQYLATKKCFLTLKHRGCEQQPERDIKGWQVISLHFWTLNKTVHPEAWQFLSPSKTVTKDESLWYWSTATSNSVLLQLSVVLERWPLFLQCLGLCWTLPLSLRNLRAASLKLMLCKTTNGWDISRKTVFHCFTPYKHTIMFLHRSDIFHFSSRSRLSDLTFRNILLKTSPVKPVKPSSK